MEVSYTSAMLSRFAWVALLSLAFACGGKSENDSNGSGGTSSGGTGGSGATGGSGGGTGGATGGTGAGGTGGVPQTCESPSSSPGPYQTIFRFTTNSPTPVYIQDNCQLEWSLFECADGYANALSRSGACTIDCAEPSAGCIACGACQSLAQPVSANAPLEDEWSGNYFTFGTTPDGCSCHEQHAAPNAKYRATVNVYASEDDALSGTNPHAVSVDFALPAPYGYVEIPLD